jgi:holin-like protein
MPAELAKKGLPRAGFAGVTALRHRAVRDVVRWLRVWSERERQRRDLSMLSQRDFADLGVPRMLAVEEVRKWPWQQWHPQWQELEALRREAASERRLSRGQGRTCRECSTSKAAVECDRAIPVRDARQLWQAVPLVMRQVALGTLQILGLWILNLTGVWIVERLALPMPGNLVGMALLYALLALGIAKLSWFEIAGSLLIRHLAFFFVPITVGLMDAGSLLAAWGLQIMLTLAASAAIGIALAGWVSQILLRRSQYLEDAK